MAHYPLLFTLRDVVSGNAFLAGVTLSGRALMIKEGEGEWCVYGVRPAAIAEVGATPQEAYLRFRNRYREVLFDVAAEASTYEEFKSEVESFYNIPDHTEERLWEEAIWSIRSGTVTPEKPFCDLPRESPEKRPSFIGVMRLDSAQRFQASDNVADTFTLAEAA